MQDDQGVLSAFVGRPYPEPPPQDYLQWRSLVDAVTPSKPAVLSLEDFESLSPEEKKLNKRQRMAYHWAMPPIYTGPFNAIMDPFLEMANNGLRLRAGSARPGGIIDGEGYVGKTTLLLEIGRRYEKIRRKMMIEYHGDDHFMPNGYAFIPVVYISLPGEITIKSLDLLIADFYKIPLPARASQNTIVTKVKEYFAKCGTSLILVDEIHFFRLGDAEDLST